MTSFLAPFLAGFALSAALIAAIGAQNLFVLRQGLRGEHVAAVVLFCAGVDSLLITLGVAGAGAALSAAPGLTRVLTLGGAAFLAWYGIAALRRATGSGSMQVACGPALGLGGALAAAAGFTLLNPHVYLDTMLLMGAAGSAHPAPARPFFVVGAASASLVWFLALGYGARLLAPVFARPAAWRVLDALVAATMLSLAASLLSQGLG